MRDRHDAAQRRSAALRSEGLDAPSAARVVAIGETVGTTFPFTGEGIGKAMEQANWQPLRSRDALADDDPRRLEQFSWTAKRILEPK